MAMSVRSMLLRPIGSVKSDIIRRTLLVVYGAPMTIALNLFQLTLAPIVMLLVFVGLSAQSILEALVETVEYGIEASRAEPESWRIMFATFRRIWREDKATWIARHPGMVVKNPSAKPR